eukprot:2953047-Rhodomonas_salina.1
MRRICGANGTGAVLGHGAVAVDLESLRVPQCCSLARARRHTSHGPSERPWQLAPPSFELSSRSPSGCSRPRARQTSSACAPWRQGRAYGVEHWFVIPFNKRAFRLRKPPCSFIPFSKRAFRLRKPASAAPVRCTT